MGATQGVLTGDEVLPRVVAACRDNPENEKSPFLLQQWVPSCASPFTAQELVDKLLQPCQSRAVRRAVLQAPPLCLSEKA